MREKISVKKILILGIFVLFAASFWFCLLLNQTQADIADRTSCGDHCDPYEETFQRSDGWCGIRVDWGHPWKCDDEAFMAGMGHHGDEHGKDYYYCCMPSVSFDISRTDLWFSSEVKESKGVWQVCPDGKFMIGKWHRGDENGKTGIVCADINNGKSHWLDVTEHGPFKQSNHDFTCPDGKFLIGRKHKGDENGKTWYKCAKMNIDPPQKVTISGIVKDNNDNLMAGVTIQIEHWHKGHQEFHYKDTDSNGEWSQEVYKGDNFAVRISSGVPSGSTIKAINNRSCHSDASTYEWQVAGEKKFKGCGYDDYRSWDLDTDNSYDFVVTLPAVTCSYKKCVGSECVKVIQSLPCPADECSSDSDCGGSDGSTCDCTPWVNQGCGGNGCEPTEMWRTRRCCCSGGCFNENDCERHGDCLNFHAQGLIWTANGDPIAFIDRNGNMFLEEFWYDHRTGGWFGDEKFKIKCGSSIVARMDSRGNLYLKGALITKGSPKDKGFVIKSNGVVVAQIDCSGNLILKGKVYKNINAVW